MCTVFKLFLDTLIRVITGVAKKPCSRRCIIKAMYLLGEINPQTIFIKKKKEKIRVHAFPFYSMETLGWTRFLSYFILVYD